MPKIEKYPTKAQVTGKEKRQKPTKHYVFIVQVTWTDGSRVPIYRQYSDFYQLHTDLQEFISVIPEDEAKVTLPVFPAKKVFERAEISKTASARKHAFDGYCKAVLDYEILAKSQIVRDFFLPNRSDINPVIEPEDRRRRSSLLSALSVLLPKKDEDKKETISKSKSNTALDTIQDDIDDDPVYVSSPLILESYLVLADYVPQEKGEVLLKEDHIVQVVEKHTNGWWFLSTEYGDGWGPATHLQSQDPNDNEEPDPIYSGSKYITTNSYTADSDTHDEVSFPEGAMVDVLHKLMDGWWIIKYQGEVGYAPATYLAPFKNPHYRDSRYGQRQNKRPTKRKSTIKNSKGQYISASVRDKSRDLLMYKKLSGKKSAAQAADIAKKMNSDQIKEKETAASNAIVKPKLRREVSVESYEYIDEDEMEDINEWVDENILKKKQEEEESKKHDYENVPKIVISDESEEVPSVEVRSTSQSEPDESVRKSYQSAPRAPNNSRQQSSAGAARKDMNTDETIDVKENDTTQNEIVHIESESLARNPTESENSAKDTNSENPKEIDEMLTIIRQKRISRIYTNKQGEIVIKFSNPEDMAAFGVCDIRDKTDTCPLDPDPSIIPKQTNKPVYSKVSKPKAKENRVKSSTDEQDGHVMSNAKDNNNKEKPKSKTITKKLEQEFAIYV